MKRVLLATGNKFKLNQMQFVADYLKLPLRIVPARDIFGALAKYEKLGEAPVDVALRGAKLIYGKIKRPIVTEETFLKVKALNGFPGLKSIEFVKKEGRKALLTMMEGMKNRKAELESVCVFINEKGKIKKFKHKIKGEITHKERWIKGPLWVSPEEEEWGGWYNAIFKPKGSNKTLAEMTSEELINLGYREGSFAKAIKHIHKEPEPEF